MTNIQYNKLKKFMTDSSFTFTDEWLTACVSWITENYPTNQITDQFLKEQIFEQWLGTDLAEMECSCLPRNLEQKRCMQLTGRFGLQINSLQDIGESSYTQLNKLKKTVNENTSVEARDSNHVKPSWEPKPRRCLYLSMTDGTQKVFGLEMTSIPSITLAVKPGVKVLIIGPVESRRGVLQLKPANVKLLGGEVEQLGITNAVENILARNLRQPENTAPVTAITESQLDRLGNHSTNTTQQSQSQQESRINVNTNNVNNFGEFPDDDDFEIASADAFDDDDLFMDIDESALIASASLPSASVNSVETVVIPQNSFLTEPVNSFHHPNFSRRSSADVQQPSTFEFDDDDDFEPSGNFSRSSSRNISVTSVATSSTAKSMKPPVIQKSQMPSTSSSAKDKSSKSTSFKNTKTEVGKQLKIERFLKPMPVVIDPPTPEREARKKLKRSQKNEDSNPTAQENGINILSKVAVIDPITSNDQISDFPPEDETSNDSLMDLVESSIDEQLRCEEANNVDPVVPSISVSTSKITSPISVSKHPYVFLKQIHEDWETHCSTRKVLHVKACVSTLLSNIRMEDGQWALDVCITDGSGFLNCTIASVLLNEVIGFTTVEMKQLKKVPDGKAKIAKSMKDLTGTLIHWNGIFGIEIGRNPLVVSYSEIMIHHIAALKERLSHLL